MKFLPGMNRVLPLEQIILQFSQHEPSVLSAAIAVGSMHRSFESDRWPSRSPDNLEVQRTISQQQYIRAIRLLRDRLVSQQGSNNRDIALISCFLFICLELIQSDIAAAIAHLRSGLGIIREYLNRSHLPSQTTAIIQRSETLESLVDHFISLFGRLDYQSTMFGENNPKLFVVPAATRSKPALWIPPSFKDLQEARQYLDVLATAVFAFRGRIVHDLAFKDGTPPDKMHKMHARWAHMHLRQMDFKSLDARLPERQSEIETRFIEWKRIFEKFVAKNGHAFTAEDYRDIKVSRVHQIIMNLLLKECLSTRQMFFDQYIDEFREVVDIADDLDSSDLIPSFSIVSLLLIVPAFHSSGVYSS